jgi:2-dehydro-3-deoxy-D-arabinonate dehydratase
MNESSANLVPDFPALCRFAGADGLPRLGWWDGSNVLDLATTGAAWASSLAEILAAATPITSLVQQVGGSANAYALGEVTLLAPIDGQEVWAAGVTYERSRDAREQESENAADLYARVYNAERPELFFKADARRCAGPDGAIKVRPDARWTVPEPELTLVIDASLQIRGFTIGNDVSSRDIEGENPLYLPQAKVYEGACALGPWIVPTESISDPYALRIACSIARDGAIVWQDETNTQKLHRKLDELVSYLGRCNSFPAGAFLLTGTCLVPPDSLSLQTGDRVEIAIAGLGALRNVVG